MEHVQTVRPGVLQRNVDPTVQARVAEYRDAIRNLQVSDSLNLTFYLSTVIFQGRP